MDYIGPYRLMKLIRAGSTTHVWEAMDSVEHQRVAIKSLQPEFRQDKNEIASLKHEFAVGRSLDHPCVNRVLDFAIARDIPYVVMDYFNAPNLKQSIRQFPDRVQQLLPEIVQQSAQGLNHMHDQGWIHRDIKPDNFLLSEEGELRLIDFAIAQRIRKKSGLSKLFSGRSRIMGTRSYMSPEQIRGEHLDRQSDIYSLACVIFELFTRRPPFTATNADELLNKHLRASAPTIVSFNRDVTVEFSRLIASMMSKKPKDRPATIGEFLDALDKIRIFTAVRR